MKSYLYFLFVNDILYKKPNYLEYFTSKVKMVYFEIFFYFLFYLIFSIRMSYFTNKIQIKKIYLCLKNIDFVALTTR